MLDRPIDIKDASLYLLSDLIENSIKDNYVKLEALDEASPEFKALKETIEAQETSIGLFIKNVDDARHGKFQFSIEELYSMYGQYDNRTLYVTLHKYSESASRYGRNVSGTLSYSVKERAALEETIHQDEVPRTQGVIKLDSAKTSGLSDDKKAQLIEEGFDCSDIYQISATNFDIAKNYNVVGRKEIPNTINIEFDPTGFDHCGVMLMLITDRLKKGGVLTSAEWLQTCGYSFNYNPESKGTEPLKSIGHDEDGVIWPVVRYHELEARFVQKKCSGEELIEFSALIGQRVEMRTASLEKELKRSTNKTLDKFKEDHPGIFKGIQEYLYQFNDGTLVHYDAVKPIHWDFEGFLHVYLRHCDELAIEGHFEAKTKFQYNKKDIRRILVIAIERLLPKINERLKAGNDYRLYGDRSLYFNGNYYSLHISEIGRVMAFHPIN